MIAAALRHFETISIPTRSIDDVTCCPGAALKTIGTARTRDFRPPISRLEADAKGTYP